MRQSQAARPSESDVAMLAYGVLLASAPVRDQLASHVLPGEPSDAWTLATTLASDEQARELFVNSKIGTSETTGNPVARLLRCFLASEIERRQRQASFAYHQLVRFDPKGSAEMLSLLSQLAEARARMEDS